MTTGETVDWTVLNLDGIAEVVDRAARRVAARYAGIVEADDVRQYGMIHLAGHPDLVRQHHRDDTLSLLQHWLWCRLTDATRPAARRANRTISWERTMENAA